MKRTMLFVLSVCVVLPLKVNAVVPASRPLAPAQDKQKFAQAQKANAAALRGYTWKSRTELKLKGESKSIKVEQVRYDVNGQLQKTPLDSGAPQQQQQPSGGRLKQKIIAKKKAEFGEMIKGLAGLVTSYAHLPQNQMQAYAQNASFKLGQEEGAIQITGQPAVVPGDSMSIWVDPSTMLFRRVAINTVYEKKPVSVDCTYANTSSGLNYMAKAVLDYPGENVQVTVDNYEYERSMSGSQPQTQSRQRTTQQPALPPDPGWPRQSLINGNQLITYQPQVDDWKDFQELQARMAFSLTPTGGKAVVGVVSLRAHTDVDRDQDLVVLSNLRIVKTDFPALDSSTATQMDQLVRTFLPKTYSLSLHRLAACVPKNESQPTVPVKNDAPKIFVSNSPGILLFVDGEPVQAPIKNTNMAFVVNTSWPLFVDKQSSKFYLLVDQQWMTAGSLDDKWAPTAKLPKDMSRLSQDTEWASLAKVIPPAAPSGAAPNVFYSTSQAEVIVFDGKPVFARIPGTQLLYATNTPANVFMDGSTSRIYYLTAGRWFRADSLDGPWIFATPDLPADFSRIPPNTPAARVLSAVPGTDEAKDAVLLAQVPTTMVVDPAAAAAQAKVAYDGDPQFKPIEGTSLSYATNTNDKVIKFGDVYYLCLQAVWFMSTTASGPWTTAASVPQEIYTIPPSSPVYNVTYVTQTTTSSGSVESSYTAGYMGAFMIGTAVGLTIAYGTGYYYPPYYGYPVYGYPVYRPYAMTYGAFGYYNTGTGAYGVAQTVYGPYGSATRAASYNPYTGTYARGASVSTPYGSRSAAQAYNPYTGTYAATRQGSSPTAQWGSSVVTRGNQAAYGQHYSTNRGTVGSIQTSSGGKVVGASGAGGSGFAGKTSGGDMYAGKDGNVYKNTGSGWQKYDNGSWNSAQPKGNAAQSRSGAAQSSGGAAQRQSSFDKQGMQQEMQNRQRGATQSGRFQGGGGGGGGGFSRGGGGGFSRGGGGRSGGRRR